MRANNKAGFDFITVEGKAVDDSSGAPVKPGRVNTPLAMEKVTQEIMQFALPLHAMRSTAPSRILERTISRSPQETHLQRVEEFRNQVAQRLQMKSGELSPPPS